jgi:hypothetical protein
MLVARIVKLVEVTFTCQGFAIGAFECIMAAVFKSPANITILTSE